MHDEKDTDMPECSICLVSFVPDDEIILFSCDKKHYFHRKCGAEWLVLKTDCPLCRRDFNDDFFLSLELCQEVARGFSPIFPDCLCVNEFGV